MAIRFSAEIKIGSRIYNIPIFIYSKTEKKEFECLGYLSAGPQPLYPVPGPHKILTSFNWI